MSSSHLVEGRWRVGGKAHDHGGGAGLVGGGAANGAAGPAAAEERIEETD